MQLPVKHISVVYYILFYDQKNFPSLGFSWSNRSTNFDFCTNSGLHKRNESSSISADIEDAFYFVEI